ncbi:MAG: apolipoprotein N-acyltransferase [Sulfurimonas sp.]|nr:apolipoprotein N-acyltransferase [Sulfurimonas sp.]
MLNIIQTFKKNNNLLYELLLGLITALLFSAFIYLEEFGFTIQILNTIFALCALALFLYIPKRSVLVAGFSIGILWFYWIAYSFEYQGVGYMAPFIIFSFGIIYMLFFGVLALTNKVYIRAVLIFALSYFEPFDWNWLQIELIFVDSYIGIYKYQLASVLVSLSLISYIKKPYKYAPLILLLVAINYSTELPKLAPLKIKLVQTDIKQEKKWKRETLRPTISYIYKEIQTATSETYDIVVFPESVFPLYMNKHPRLVHQLSILSKDIAIVAGSLYKEDGKNYNVTYLFEDGKYKIAKKLVLVPFGEYIPLPKFAIKIINDTFFSGTSDFKTASSPTDFIIKGVKFRNAICYEATCQEIYEGDVNFVIASSNNAWFAPSIEPTLQKLLMRYYARKNGVTIYHSANYKGTGIVR